MDILNFMLVPFTQPALFLLTGAGVLVGIYVGAIPGLSVTMAVSLLISFTYSWKLMPAVAVMIGIYVGGVYGGSRSAILLNIPGAPGAVATVFDGYPLAQRGLAGKAIGITAIYSVIGGLIGAMFLAVGATAITRIALLVDSMDYFLLALIALFTVGTISCNSPAKGAFSVFLGLAVGMIGLDFATCMPRFTFGSLMLLNGINYISAMIGLLGVSEALMQLHNLEKRCVKQDIRDVIPSGAEVRRYLPLAIRSSLIGTLIGALPGAGGDIAAMVAYGAAKRTVKNPEVPFGKGAIEGVVAPESANNACCGGALIPMLTLGIPGDAVTAVLIGAMNIHGINAGPTMVSGHPEIFWVIISSLFIANIFLGIFGLLGIRLFTKLAEIPKEVLMPLIIVLSVIGAYSVNNNIYDVYWMLLFGMIGYVFKRMDIPVAPMILGLILTQTIEQNFRRAVLLSGSSLSGFIVSMFDGPISIFLSVLMLCVVLRQFGIQNLIRSAAAGSHEKE